MADNAVAPITSQAIEGVLIGGDLKELKPQDRVAYYTKVCESLGLNPLTQPFAYLSLSGKLTLYARKDAAEQLRSVRGISLKILSREIIDGVYVVTAGAATPSGRVDEATGAVPIENLKGEAKANAMMKAETKAKRRVTLSICGLGLMDESEVDSVAGMRKVSVEDAHSGKLLEARKEEKRSDPKPAPTETKAEEGRKIPEDLQEAVKQLRAKNKGIIAITKNFLQDECCKVDMEPEFLEMVNRAPERMSLVQMEDLWLDIWYGIVVPGKRKATPVESESMSMAQGVTEDDVPF